MHVNLSRKLDLWGINYFFLSIISYLYDVALASVTYITFQNKIVVNKLGRYNN